MDLASLKSDIKILIVAELNLQGRDPQSIEDDAPLFNDPRDPRDGLGLDSLDALQLAMSIEEQYAVRIPEGEGGRTAFASINALADWVSTHGASK